MRLRRFILVFLLFPFLFACDSKRLYEKNVDFEQKYWAVNNIPEFVFDVADPTISYNIYFNVRNTLSFPYQNLYVTYYLEDSTGNLLSSALQNLVLFDKKTGAPLGKGLGDIFDHQIPVLSNYKFEQGGQYQLRVEQFMRTDTLSDVLSVGVRVEKAH
ncbi:gliding motility lipoprotein GldH [Xanthovirga aplysinae]|uniref:gliding motility lipoprotein GldH n=1 Tax=Xanthovirga aplysinae TaxID=2529853 RepID=UPI0012BCDC44|nr:gliding motility lipoprotein GldH [Xanthovirga aplysinae]MTI31702.1 gliding motility lipoprotein GldH [Xanthovirga aplysinae]